MNPIKPTKVIPGKRYIVFEPNLSNFFTDLSKAVIAWGQPSAEHYFPTWKELQYTPIEAIKPFAKLWNGWQVKSLAHGFEFSLRESLIYEPSQNLCTCDMQVLMCRGCQCGGN